ncbi:competence type IV pilus major pilin ComGC [Mycoplasma sp. P36-A1]|uniref:competence type IV pilus major pilin ComGC n=1 Tax=Mycoplasma sp. P36-A1 TaxID=3252900 RepID=UPI003C2B52EF
MIIDKKGFTMLEMLIVIAVIALLLSLVVPNLTSRQQLISEKGCEALKETVNAQIYMYHVEHKKYPTGIRQLINGNYLSNEQTTCDNNKKIDIQNNVAVIVE